MGTPMSRISLVGNEIGEAGAFALADALEHPGSKVTYLALDDRGIARLREAWARRVGTLRIPSTFLPGTTSLHRVDKPVCCWSFARLWTTTTIVRFWCVWISCISSIPFCARKA